MDDRGRGLLPCEEFDLRRARWDRMVDSHTEWVWAAVGRSQELFHLFWLRLADRWQEDDEALPYVLLQDVLSGVRRGSSVSCAPSGSPSLGASGGS